MADDLDRASEREQIDREQAIAAARAPSPGFVINGACHWCGDMTDKVFCSVGCRDDHQREIDAKKRNGN